MLKEADFETWQAWLLPGDLLFLYTDGITEARGPGGSLLSPEGLEALLRSADRSTPEALVRGVVEEVKRFAGQDPQADDLTALAVCYPGPPASQGGPS